MLALVLTDWYDHQVLELVPHFEPVADFVDRITVLGSLIHDHDLLGHGGLRKNARLLDRDVDHLSVLAADVESEALLADDDALLEAYESLKLRLHILPNVQIHDIICLHFEHLLTQGV